jgi:hypothetical protein
VLVVIAYMIYDYLVPKDRQYAGVREAQTLPLVLSIRELISTAIPADIADAIMNPGKPDSGQTATEPATGETTSPEAEGYQKNEAQGLDQLIQGGEQQQTGETGEQPAFGGQTNPN